VKVCVFGAGAIGGYLGAQLARAGVDVSLVARGEHLAAMATRGLRLQINGEERIEHLPVPIDHLSWAQDCVIIALKAHQIGDAVEAMLPLLADDTDIVTTSNGLPYWYFYGARDVSVVPRLRASIPAADSRDCWASSERLAAWCIRPPRSSPQASYVTNTATNPLGAPDGHRSQRLERLRDDCCRRP
jgi:2-dehydropantoate 2-reductase